MFSVVNLAFKYLGFPLGAKVEDISIWHPVMVQIVKRLPGWKKDYMFKGVGSFFSCRGVRY